MLGSSLAAFLFLAQAMTSDISLGLKFRLSLVGSLTRERQAHRAGWALADFHSVEPTTKRVGRRVSAHYQACVCGLGYGCYVRCLTGSLVIIGFSQKPRWLFKSLSATPRNAIAGYVVTLHLSFWETEEMFSKAARHSFCNCESSHYFLTLIEKYV